MKFKKMLIIPVLGAILIYSDIVAYAATTVLCDNNTKIGGSRTAPAPILPQNIGGNQGVTVYASTIGYRV